MNWLKFPKAKKTSTDLKYFHETLEFAKKQNKLNHSSLYLLIRALGENLKWQSINDCIEKDESQLRTSTSIGNLFFDLQWEGKEYSKFVVKKELGNEKVCLKRDTVITNPWMKSRLLGAISPTKDGSIKDWTQDNNHKVKLYLPFRIATVSGGNHSIARGMIDSDSCLTPKEVYDYTELLREVGCDGEYFYDVNSQVKIARVKNIKFAAIWEVARLMV